jgi:hypothetical protein
VRQTVLVRRYPVSPRVALHPQCGRSKPRRRAPPSSPFVPPATKPGPSGLGRRYRRTVLYMGGPAAGSAARQVARTRGGIRTAPQRAALDRWWIATARHAWGGSIAGGPLGNRGLVARWAKRTRPGNFDSRLEGGVNRAKLKFTKIITTTSRG